MYESDLHKLLDGVVTALVTPYKHDGEVDYQTFRELLQQQAQWGVRAVLVGGTTGEGHLLDDLELRTLIEVAARETHPKLAIVGNTGGLNTRTALERTKAGFEAGMVASLQITPYYGKTSRRGCAAHFDALLDVGPAIIYNNPARTNYDLQIEEILSIAKHRNFIGLKECVGIERMRLLHLRGIPFWSGNDEHAYEARHAMYSLGVFSIAGNILPRLMVELMRERNPQTLAKVLRVLSLLTLEPNPIVIKTLLGLTGAIQPVFRLPYAPLESKRLVQCLEVLYSLASDNIVGNTRQMSVDFATII